MPYSERALKTYTPATRTHPTRQCHRCHTTQTHGMTHGKHQNQPAHSPQWSMRTDTFEKEGKPLTGHPCPHSPAPQPTRAEQSKRTCLSVDLARDHFPTTPPRPRHQMKGLNELCTGLCDMCTDSESSPRNDLPKSDKHVRMAQALRDATSSSRPLCGRPERATTDLNSQVLARCAVGMVWALPDGLSGHAQAGFET